ncbi:hypothetical protein F3Y22_tig00113096pilonHSYRG00118 [Hibiscus syriacus]|uniref:Zinc beta-ribbon domain-containing protein n=1 Tax=Hibiscus syriacus TaxID=106335 RepID=A0A6A2WR91_HIBSY|nr:hypothetical protein F3Y22_tig00113096pilonHSYRG00118 [Hibiscus syriacus]
MECNREEAVKAKGIAEQKMQDGDLEGAKLNNRKCRILVKTARKPASRASKKAASRPLEKAFVNGPHEFTNGDQNCSSKFTASYAYQQAQHQTFWTLCSACGVKYQYYKDFVNKSLLCPTCGFQFIAFDLVKRNVDGFPNTRDEKKGGDMPMPTASEPKGSGTSGNGKKRGGGRKTVEVSDESHETETADAVGSEDCGLNSKANTIHPPRKSSKQKPITDYFSWQKRA